jgi:ArsR family transcriptional regulator, arsenate/arsenite/antimonite-responsive transcriptional repressor
MADIFDVVADATRRDILRVLLDSRASGAGDGEISVSQIVAKLELSQPTVSKHLKVLREAGLVHVREEGQHRYYRLESGPLEDLDDWLMPFLESHADRATHDESLGVEALNAEALEFASTLGKALADTSHAVTGAVQRVATRTRRHD